jgi:hypothetical protein
LYYLDGGGGGGGGNSSSNKYHGQDLTLVHGQYNLHYGV